MAGAIVETSCRLCDLRKGQRGSSNEETSGKDLSAKLIARASMNNLREFSGERSRWLKRQTNAREDEYIFLTASRRNDGLRAPRFGRRTAYISNLKTSDRRGYGATVARLTPDQKVGSSNLSALINQYPRHAHICARQLKRVALPDERCRKRKEKDYELL